MRELDIDKQTASYYAGSLINSPPKPYIQDKTKREEIIKALSEKRGKDYREILYLSYLRWNLSRNMYESGFSEYAI